MGWFGSSKQEETKKQHPQQQQQPSSSISSLRSGTKKSLTKSTAPVVSSTSNSYSSNNNNNNNNNSSTTDNRQYYRSTTSTTETPPPKSPDSTPPKPSTPVSTSTSTSTYQHPVKSTTTTTQPSYLSQQQDPPPSSREREPATILTVPEEAANSKEENSSQETAVQSNIDSATSMSQVERPTREMSSSAAGNGNGNNGKDVVDLEDPSKSYSKDETSDPGERDSTHEEVTRQNHLNSVFNGHLMKWKYEAEEGNAFVRVPAFFGAIGLIATAIVAIVLYPEAWTPHAIVISTCVVIMSFFIIVLDGRFLSSNPLSARAHLRNILTRNFNIFRFLWGRGLLYIVAGTLNIAQTWQITMISGGLMVFMGLLSIAVGVNASRKFAALRNSLADESFLLLVFSNYDGDGDGFLDPNEFAWLLNDLGMELDDRYTLKAFTVIDTDNDRKISFNEFSHWWSAGYIERGRRRLDDDDESYQRLD